MKIALISDSHDNVSALEQVLTQIAAEECEALLHLGDLIAPFIVAQIAEGFPAPIHIIEGNNDGDGRLQMQVASGYPHVTLHGPYAELDFSARKIAMIHYPEPARRIAQSRHFDLVAYGHDHTAHEEQIGDTLLVNPGEVMGRLGAPTWGIYDSILHSYTQYTLEP